MTEEKTNILSDLAGSISTLAEGFKKFKDETFGQFREETNSNFSELNNRIKKLEDNSGTETTK